ncbi:MAG: hypothetical protein QMC98_04975 [Candidatus Thermoplasmatota archaeon]|nr:hypothetical protein [Candidatus Thermoplasmatota archaeon]
MKSVLVLGLGDMGSRALEYLALSGNKIKIIGADLNEELGRKKVNSALGVALRRNYYPELDFVKIDLNDVKSTSSILRKLIPTVILHTVSTLSWWEYKKLPDKLVKKLDSVGFGPWLPANIIYDYKLMKAVRSSGIKTHVINAPYPDVANPVLAKLDLAPTVGFGNFDLLVPAVRKIVSDKLNIKMKAIKIFLVGHHVLRPALAGELGNDARQKVPFYLKILAKQRDVTKKFSLRKLLGQASTFFPPGLGFHPFTTASAVRNVLAILNNTNELCHAPGPLGLPGGYPVRLNRNGATLFLPEDITLREAIEINEESQIYDGIEKIKDDGGVVFTDKSIKIFKEILGYKCPKEISPDEWEEKAKELKKCLYRSLRISL